VGQTLYIKGERAALDLPALFDNLQREPMRYRAALNPAGVYGWLSLAGVGAALGYLGMRLRRKGNSGDRLLAWGLAATLLVLAVVDSTKAELYALPFLPFLCVALALLAADLWQWSGSQRRAVTLPIRAAIVAGIALTLWQGLLFYRQDRRLAQSASDYQALGAAIDAAIPTGARIAGTERWWWPMRQRSYLALNNLSLQWRVLRDETGATPAFTQLLAAQGIEYVLVGPNVHGDMGREPPQLQSQFWKFIADCTTVAAQWDDPWYGSIRLHAVAADCMDGDRQSGW
jgi:hypothetical protein